MRDAMMQAYDAFRFCQLASGGSYGAPWHKHLKHWSAAARLADSAKVPVGVFIKAQFLATAMDARRTLQPVDMHSPRELAMHRFGAVQEKGGPVADHGKTREILLHRLDRARAAGVAEVDYLRDPDQSAPAWLRVLESKWDPVVLEWFGAAAKDEVAVDQTLAEYVRKVYGDDKLQRFS
jgi:hypothetical protein